LGRGTKPNIIDGALPNLPKTGLFVQALNRVLKFHAGGVEPNPDEPELKIEGFNSEPITFYFKRVVEISRRVVQ
jgi:hypothetical protein